MAQKLYIGNLPYRATEDDIRALLTRYKPIYSVILIADKMTEHSRGYGFVELDDLEAEKAVRELDNRMYMGRNIRIGKAVGRNPREGVKRSRLCLCRRCFASSDVRYCKPAC